MQNQGHPCVLRTAFVGLGTVNRNLLKILAAKRDRLAADYGLAFRPVFLADSSGVAADDDGFDPDAVCRLKESGGRVSGLPAFLSGRSLPEALEASACDLVMEASPVDLESGEPGLGVARAALGKGVSVVLANKGPLVLAFRELHALAAESGAGLAFSATVCGGLPVINIGRRDLVAADITRLRGVFNSTSNYLLEEMTAGRPFAAALAEAQRLGIAEADPALDVDGWDTANKLVIIANSFLGRDATLGDVEVTGIANIGAEELRDAAAQGKVIKLVAAAEGGRLTVKPTLLAPSDFLAGCGGWEMGVEIHSDIYGIQYHKLYEREPVPTAAAMLRDAVNLFAGK